MNAVPTVQEELNRKTMAAIEKLEFDRQIGKCTEAEYAYALSVLWEAVAGLVDKDFFEITAVMAQSLKGVYEVSEFFHSRMLGWTTAKITNTRMGYVILDLYSPNTDAKSQNVYDFTDEANMFLASKNKVEALQQNLIKKGFSKI